MNLATAQFGGVKSITESVDSVCRDGTDTPYVAIQIEAGVTGNPFRADFDPGGSHTLAKSIPRIASASDFDPPPDELR